MDKSRFTSRKTGQLLQIDRPGNKDWAFLPDDLPPDWEFPLELWPLLGTAKARLGELNGIGRTLPNPSLLQRPLQTREAITSSALEGTVISAEQMFLFELNPPSKATAKSETASNWIEVRNYGEALTKGIELLKELPFCLRIIREMHNTLMQGVRGQDKTPGDFRKWQVQIGHDARFVPPPVTHLDECLNHLEKYMNDDDSRFDPLVKAFLIHYQFETIHPFTDGNGRVGRALLASMIYKWCEHSIPLLYLSEFFERYKDEYFKRLFGVSINGEWSEWIEFCLRGTIYQAEDAIRRCDALKKLRDEYHAKVEAPTPRTHAIIEDLFFNPMIHKPGLVKKHNVTFPTASTDIEKLVAAGILKEVGGIRPTTYYATEIIRIAFGAKPPE